MAVVAQNTAKPSVDQRLARIERLMGSRALVDMSQQLQSLRNEVRALRGQLEEQAHLISRLNRQQRQLYSDLDERTKVLEESGVADTGDPVQTAAVSDSPAPNGGDAIAEQRAYQTAFDLLKEGRYEEASSSFSAFLSEYPQGRYADNAQYWLAESYYVSRKFSESLREFRTLVERYPSSSKLSGSKLKIGFIHHELGEITQAKRALNAVIEEYPRTTVERLARDRLAQIGG